MVRRREAWVTQEELNSDPARSGRWPAASPSYELPEALSPAEREVVVCALRGASNREIAELRGVSPNTIANQLRSVYAKLGIRSRRALAQHCPVKAHDPEPS